MKELIGRFQGTARGYGFLLTGDGGPDWFIPPGETAGAWDGDEVSARPLGTDDDGQRQTAKVTAVRKRAATVVTGRLAKLKNEMWLLPDSDKLPKIRIPARGAKPFPAGEKVAVKMLSFGTRVTPPMGAVLARFGRADSRAAAVEAILFNYEISPDFPDEAMAQAHAAPKTVPPEAAHGRLDLRDALVITIDGAAAKDLDDAVSLSHDEHGNTILGVHIADVSHYVTHNSPLDREALERGTSVYFADRVVPMLPPALSNGICSLNPQVDRLTLSCVMTVDKHGFVTNHTIAKSVIRTAERMTYEDCNVLLEGGDDALAARYAHVLPLLRDLNALAARLSKKRRGRGALMLETSETGFVCDDDGKPVAVFVRRSGRAESLIEECMLLANETVAEHLCHAGAGGVFRIHERPSLEKTETLRAMLAPLGYELPEQADGHALQKILNAAAGKPEQAAVHMMILRALMKARYDAEDRGHFGLAASHYCHFTSPIRRYPDLVVHRMLSALTGDGRDLKKLTKFTVRAAEQSSRRELAAVSAEREIEKCYAAEYMAGHIGKTFPAVVSGVTKFGVYVTLENGVEGMISREALPGDAYHYDEKRLTLSGEQHNIHFSFGMSLPVVCIDANAGTGEVAFAPEGITLHSPPPKRAQRHGKSEPSVTTRKSYRASKRSRRR